MKIGINASWMTPGAAGGHEWYLRNLIEQLAAIDRENHYVLVTGPNNYKTFKLPGPNWSTVVYAGTENTPDNYIWKMPIGAAKPLPPAEKGVSFPRQTWRNLYHWWHGNRVERVANAWNGPLAELISHHGIELWFCPFMFALPLDTRVPIVTCIPDLQQEHYPDFFNDADRTTRAMGYQHSCKCAAAVIAVSKFTADEIVKLYDVDPDRVFPIPLGIDKSFYKFEKDLDRLKSHARLKYRLDEDYIYYPAAGWQHKNHENLIKALAIARDRGCKLKLILTGWEFDLMKRIGPMLKQLGLQDQVRHLGYIDRGDVVGLLAASKAMIFPSLFEGFGLPIVEAMHLGVPIACANLCSLPEVGGDAVEFFDPLNPEAIADSILKLTTDANFRRRVSEAGKTQADKFTYRRTAEETLRVFNKIKTGELKSPGLDPFKPPIPYNWLHEGHSRWYFHCAKLKDVTMEILQPLTQITDQRIQVLLDGKTVIDASIAAEETKKFTIPANGHVGGGFHRLDVIASQHFIAHDQKLTVRVLDLNVNDTNGRKMRLVR